MVPPCAVPVEVVTGVTGGTLVTRHRQGHGGHGGGLELLL